MIPADYYADEGYDHAGELLCTAPDELPASPASCLSAAFVDITRTAASAALHREYSHDLPPALPPTV